MDRKASEGGKDEVVDVEKGGCVSLSVSGSVSLSVSGSGDGERECRVCHMGVEKNQDIELGCACKADLAFAHKQCAETWFKIKGDRTCEICGSTARNVVGVEDGEVVEQWNDGNAPTSSTSDERNSWLGHRFLNFLLACVIFAFVISWLFRFGIPA